MLGAYNEGLEACPGNKTLEKGAEYASKMIEQAPPPPKPKPKKKQEKKKVELTQ
jgi:hypothetical protein